MVMRDGGCEPLLDGLVIVPGELEDALNRARVASNTAVLVAIDDGRGGVLSLINLNHSATTSPNCANSVAPGVATGQPSHGSAPAKLVLKSMIACDHGCIPAEKVRLLLICRSVDTRWQWWRWGVMPPFRSSRRRHCHGTCADVAMNASDLTTQR